MKLFKGIFYVKQRRLITFSGEKITGTECLFFNPLNSKKNNNERQKGEQLRFFKG